MTPWLNVRAGVAAGAEFTDADGKRVAIYGKTREELYEKVQEAKRQIEEASMR